MLELSFSHYEKGFSKGRFWFRGVLYWGRFDRSLVSVYRAKTSWRSVLDAMSSTNSSCDNVGVTLILGL